MVDTKSSEQKILIVDDIPKNLQILGNILDAKGFDICFATNGKQALQLAENNMPDLILLDISMPEMDGFEVCEKIKTSPAMSNIPIIFLTAYTDTDSIVKAFKAGGQDYITKPFNPAELMARVNTHLELKNKRERIEQQAKQLLEWNKLQSELNKSLNEQKNIITQKNKSLTDSLNYAKIIQDAMLSNAQKLRHYFNNAFIIYLPKDIVSGDFYFFERITVDTAEGKKEKIIIAIADCTGHGVPGALLTMLGMSMLKQLVVYEKMINPSEILHKLNIEISDMLTNKEHNKRSSDGMDMAISVISPDENQLVFSGCKRPIYIISNEKLHKYNGSIHAIGGYYDKDKKEFANKLIELNKGDKIYMFSDGYADQFGGERNKKYNSNRFRTLLTEVSEQSMEKQQESMLTAHFAWRGDHEQVDDITVLGFEY